MEEQQIDIDQRICDAFQTASDWIEEYTGVTCFNCARFFLVIEMTLGLTAYKKWLGDLHWIFAFVAMFVCIGFLIGILRVWSLERICASSRWAKNPERLRSGVHRLGNIVSIAAFFAMWLFVRNTGLIFYVGYCTAYGIYRYFVACTPLPPDFGTWVPQGA